MAHGAKVISLKDWRNERKITFVAGGEAAQAPLLVSPAETEKVALQLGLPPEKIVSPLPIGGAEFARRIAIAAWEEDDPSRREAAARRALEFHRDCGEAYVLLAVESGHDFETQLSLYRQGINAFERHAAQRKRHPLPPADSPLYWKGMMGLAEALWKVGDKAGAVEQYRLFLRQRPAEGGTGRMKLAAHLLEMERYDYFRELLAGYPDDGSALWIYAQALYHFRLNSATREASAFLSIGIMRNPAVVDYLLGTRELPGDEPQEIGPGKENEAVWCAWHLAPTWRRTEGALDWLRKQAFHKS